MSLDTYFNSFIILGQLPQLHKNSVQFNSQLAKEKIIATQKIVKIPL